MTLVQEAAEIMEQMPQEKQKIAVEMLRVMSYNFKRPAPKMESVQNFKRTGLSDFNLPPDFDEHFADADEEISEMFYGGKS